ncbi:MAG TPA: thioesterase family protein [Steroidobacteraceae bacterium]
MSKPAPEWDFPRPHWVTVQVTGADIDAYGHVNNSIYLSWLDCAAWSHSAALGVPLEHCLRLRRGMAAHRTEIDYLRAAVLDDEIQVATWITASDGKLRVERHFQLRRSAEGRYETVARARTQYVCIHLDSGRAVRMPEVFSRAYGPPQKP